MSQQFEVLIDDDENVSDEIGYHPAPGNPGGRIANARVITSSGEAPTGGTTVGGAADRVIPDRWIREHSTATNEDPEWPDPKLEG